MARANPVLAIIGNPPMPVRSEREAWGHVQKLAQRLQDRGVTVHFAREVGSVIAQIASDLLHQIGNGVHVNPSRLKGRTRIASHVQAVAYIHAKDGGAYVHGFGNCDPDETDLQRGILKLNALKTVTNVAMYGEPDGSVTLVGTKGQPLAALFD